MASGPYWHPERGTWSVQWWDGSWHRSVVVKKQPGWKPDPTGKTPRIPPEAQAALARFAKLEQAARSRTHSAAPPTLRAFLTAHIDSYTGATQKATRLAAESFLGWCETRKITRIDQVTTAVAQEWTDALAEESAIQTSKNRIDRLAVAWSRALRRGQVASNPWLAVEPRGYATRPSRGSWTLAQFDRLLRAARPWLRDILVVGIHTGIRITALSGLEWRDVEWARESDPGFGWLRVRPELDKGKRGYRVPMGPRLHSVLARRWDERSDEHKRVISGMHGRPTSGKITGKSIRRACKRAGLPDPDSPNHHMRRTFGRWAVLGHLTGTPVPLYVVSRWLGHSSVSMTLRYLDITEEDSTRFMLGESAPTTPPSASDPTPRTP